MIVGFDSDDETVFERQFAFLKEARIVAAMTGMLSAIPKTPLYERLEAEGRLDNAAIDDPEIATNIIPLLMTRETLRDGWLTMMDRLYQAENYFDRFDALFVEGRIPLATPRINWLRRHRPLQLPEDPGSHHPRRDRHAGANLERPANPPFRRTYARHLRKLVLVGPAAPLPLPVRLEVHHPYPLRHHDPADGARGISAREYVITVLAATASTLGRVGHQGRADPVLEARVGGQGLQEVVLREHVEFHVRPRHDGAAVGPLEVRRDHAEALAEAELLVELAVEVGVGDARADDVEAIAILPLADDRLAGPAGLDGHGPGQPGDGGLAQALQRLELRQGPGDPHGDAGERVGDDPAADHVDDAIGVVDHALIVSDQEDGRPLGTVRHAPEQLQDRLAGFGVERGGRLVGEDQRRVIDERPGDGDPLLLAPRERCRQVVDPLAQPELA